MFTALTDPAGVTAQRIGALERAGFVTRHVSEHGADYAETLRHWARRLDENLDEALRLAGPEQLHRSFLAASIASTSRAACPAYPWLAPPGAVLSS